MSCAVTVGRFAQLSDAKQIKENRRVGSEGNTESFAIRENDFDPEWSKTLCTYGSYLHGSREIPPLGSGNGPEVRAVNPSCDGLLSLGSTIVLSDRASVDS